MNDFMQITLRESQSLQPKNLYNIFTQFANKEPSLSSLYSLSTVMKMQERLPSVTTMKCYHFQWKSTTVSERTSKNNALIPVIPKKATS